MTYDVLQLCNTHWSSLQYESQVNRDCVVVTTEVETENQLIGRHFHLILCESGASFLQFTKAFLLFDCRECFYKCSRRNNNMLPLVATNFKTHCLFKMSVLVIEAHLGLTTTTGLFMI